MIYNFKHSVYCFRRDDISLRTKLDGLNALNNSFAFAAANFARQAERNFLMQVNFSFFCC